MRLTNAPATRNFPSAAVVPPDMRTRLFLAFVVIVSGVIFIVWGIAVAFETSRILDNMAGLDMALTKRAVDHQYGTSVVVEYPGGKGVYFRWCDPEGYLLFSNGFNENSPIMAVRDDRCKGIR